MMAGSGWDTFGSVEGEGVGPEGVEGGEERGEDAGVIQNLVDALEGGELRIRNGGQRAVGCWLLMSRLMRRGAVRDFVLKLVDFIMHGAEDGVLAPEAGEREDASQRQAADEEGGVGDGHEFSQAAELPHVDDAPHGVHHAAGCEEEEGLEKGVREEVEHAAGDAAGHSRAESKEHVAELTDRGIGQDALQVELRERDEAGEQSCKAADAGDDELRGGRSHEQRRATGDHIDAGSDHRGGVDKSANGGRAFHRIGKPDVQWELGTFAARPEEQQQANGGGQASGDVVTGCDAALTEDAANRAVVVEVERAVGSPNEKYGDGEAEVADAVDEKRLHAGRGRFRLLVPEANEQIAADADRLPEYEQQDEVADADQHRHGEHEQADVGEEPPVAAIPLHVAGGEDGDQSGNESDHDEHHGREGIGPEGHFDAEISEAVILGERRVEVIGVRDVRPGPEGDDFFKAAGRR